jgi:hypothetical protein
MPNTKVMINKCQKNCKIQQSTPSAINTTKIDLTFDVEVIVKTMLPENIKLLQILKISLKKNQNAPKTNC